MADNHVYKVPDSDRIAELWMAIKVLLAGKVDTSALSDYPTIDGVITMITQALTSYPTDGEVQASITAALSGYMTTSEVNDAIVAAVSSASGLHYELVDQLPSSGDSKVIYLVPNGTTGSNFYDEWFYYDNKWEFLGTTEPDLSNYWNKDELQIMTKSDLEEILI